MEFLTVVYFFAISAVIYIVFILFKKLKFKFTFIHLNSKKAREIYKMFPKDQKTISIEEIGKLIKWRPDDIRKIKITSFSKRGPFITKDTNSTYIFNKPDFTQDDFKKLLWLLFCSDITVDVNN